MPDSSAQQLTIHNPYDRSEIKTISLAGPDDVEQALQQAEQTFRDREQWLSIPLRIEILANTAQQMSERRLELAQLATQEGGKPLCDSLIEVDRAIDGVRNCIEVIRTQSGTEIPMRINPASLHRSASTFLEPIGPVLAFSAFNHPLNLIVHQVAPAIAVGMSCDRQTSRSNAPCRAFALSTCFTKRAYLATGVRRW